MADRVFNGLKIQEVTELPAAGFAGKVLFFEDNYWGDNGVEWHNLSYPEPIVIITSTDPYTITHEFGDVLVLSTAKGDQVINLPDSSKAKITVKNLSTGIVSLQSGVNIDGEPEQALEFIDDFITTEFDGTTWRIIAKNENATSIAGFVVNAPDKSTPVDGDAFAGLDSEDAYSLNRFAWANIKATLKTYFDTLYQAFDATLSALAAHNTAGILTQTAADTFTGRTITGTTNQVVVSNGNGVSGNPTLSLPQSIHSQAIVNFASLGLMPSSGAVIFYGKIPTTANYAQFGFQNPAGTQIGFFGYIGAAYGDSSRNDHFEVGSTPSTNLYFRPGDGGNYVVMESGGALKCTHATGGIGYGTGAGGTVTQATSKATGVTINKVCGTITMDAALLLALTIVSFTVTNSAMTATDVVHVQHDNGGTLGAYTVNPSTSAAGSFQINVRNNTAGNLSEAIVIRFAIIKAVTS